MDDKSNRPRVYTMKQAAQQLLVSERTIYRLVKANKIEAINLSLWRRGIPVSEVERICTAGVLR
jgi:excisionase family DNA binding protein